jgi:NADH-ubiquinone oxidoreductase chain 1
VGWLGILQPVVDGVKLLLKTKLKLEFFNGILFKLVALFRFFTMLLVTFILPVNLQINNYFTLLWILILLGLNRNVILISGWRSKSKYSNLGRLRSLRLRVSFEILLTLMAFLPFLLNKSFNLTYYFRFNLLFLIMIWIRVFLIENRRAPFDLSERESELVSGFNTEFIGVLFTFFFLREYGYVLISSAFTCTVFFNWNFSLLSFIFLWFILRSCYPRIKFGDIISLTWMIMLPSLFFIWITFLHSIEL